MSLSPEQKEFIEKVGLLAYDDMQRSGILASLTTAQAILESGWGKSGLTVKANALFGIKAGSTWTGKVYSADTKECYDGVTLCNVKAAFRAYDSWEDSIADHSLLLTGTDRYKTVVGEKDYIKACKAIKEAGYATDPAYSGKLISLINNYDLTAYDCISVTESAKEICEMKRKEFLNRILDVQKNYRTIYMWGVFGAPVTVAVITEKSRQYPQWYTAARQSNIRQRVGLGYFGFDCVNLIKAILWGWSGDVTKSYGGAVYPKTPVPVGVCPDISADMMISRCTGVSTDFRNIVPGEAVWLPGHIGVYIGDGKVIECTPSWDNCVQITACLNIGAIQGLNGRKWTKHGKIPYVTYDDVYLPSAELTQGNSAAGEIIVGDTVLFTGTTHYVNSNAAVGSSCKPGTAKVTNIAKGAKHQYHLIKDSGGNSTVYGWVDTAYIVK